ncbi:phosphate propanoyltransferase [uncultured Cohaesibacter sp.]|uniref:phosphate propanoyltransferase n=1 Tax=uncultured Cohaesibacter sp. TaxID=1002546 RepID=UPI002AAB4502|nr:phosphate propanoyltransferase [uncultured Cohaesibacter sp.]
MQLTEQMIDKVVADILAKATSSAASKSDPALVPVGVSNRHVHLSREDMEMLFGPGQNLTRMKAMKQPGQYAAEETVTLKGPKGELRRVRVLGPFRKETQIEISVSDGFALGIKAPMRMSGDLDESAGLEIVGPLGSVKLEQGVIVAQRHIHMHPDDAKKAGVCNGEIVSVEAQGPRGGILKNVAVRVSEASALEIHIDVEEANALGLKNNDQVRICKS